MRSLALALFLASAGLSAQVSVDTASFHLQTARKRILTGTALSVASLSFAFYFASADEPLEERWIVVPLAGVSVAYYFAADKHLRKAQEHEGF